MSSEGGPQEEAPVVRCGQCGQLAGRSHRHWCPLWLYEHVVRPPRQERADGLDDGCF